MEKQIRTCCFRCSYATALFVYSDQGKMMVECNILKTTVEEKARCFLMHDFFKAQPKSA